MLKIRSGIGYDIHRLESGSSLPVGGIIVSDKLSFTAHSDGDVLIHALIDSLLGAAALPDIGEQFPDSDPEYRNISSKKLLQQTLSLLHSRNYEIMNIDCVIIAQKPSLKDFKEKIRQNLSLLLAIPADCIGVKAKSRENLDSVGRGEAIECFVIAMIRSLG